MPVKPTPFELNTVQFKHTVVRQIVKKAVSGGQRIVQNELDLN